MIDPASDIDEQRLLEWIEQSLASGRNNLSAGYQGQTLLYTDEQHQLVIKVAHGGGVLRWIHQRLLHHEYRVYRQLGDFRGVPRCYGMAADRYLVLQRIDGTTMKQQRPQNDTLYFDTMLEYIKDMHARGVAHFDLKKNTNLLVANGDRPCLIDLGVAVIFKPGFHPINHYLFRLAKQFDYNAWIRHKYNKDLDRISDQDRPYFHKTRIEIYSYRIKRFYKDRILKPLRDHRKR